VLVLLCAFIAGAAAAKAPQLNDDQVKQQIIEASIASYPGVCACPFNRARNGSSCGRRSAGVKQEVMRQFVIRKKSLKR
jgi:hypothetical protein